MRAVRSSFQFYKKDALRHLKNVPKISRPSFRILVISFIIPALLVSIFLPVATAYATRTSTWSTNGDFSFNKIGQCAPANLANLVVSSEYTDTSCEDADSDAQLTLKPSAIPLSGVEHIATGFSTTLVLKTDGTVWGWGNNSDGLLGVGTYVSTQIPVQVKDPTGASFLTGITSITSDDGNNAYALKNDGTVFAWGNNSNGQYGNNTTTSGTLPVQVRNPTNTGALTGIVAIDAGYDSLIALKNDGTLWTVGLNNNGQLGDGTTTRRLLPIQVKDPSGTGFLTGIKEATMGYGSALALLTNGLVYSWGANDQGQLGIGTTTRSLLPVSVKDSAGTGILSNVRHVYAGGYYNSRALKEDGTVWSWGYNGSSQLGDGTTTQRALPVQVIGANGVGYLSNVVSISDGGSFALATLEDGTIVGWGFTYNGQLAQPQGVFSLTTPTPITLDEVDKGLVSITKIVATDRGSFFITSDTSVLASGYNTGGAITQNSTEQMGNVYKPTYIERSTQSANVADFAQVSASQGTVVGVKTDGTVWVWGSTYNYTFGIGDNQYGMSSATPVQVKDSTGGGYLTGITEVSAGLSHVLALKNDGTVWAWGLNNQGVLGNGTEIYATLPIQVKDTAGTGFLSGVSSISAGYTNSMAVKTDGSVWIWGDNDLGQIGDGTTTDRFTPTQVKGPGGTGTLTGVSKADLGGGWNGSTAVYTHFAVALKSDGTVWAWGGNNSGQLGDNTTTSKAYPTQVKGTGGTGTLTGVSSVAAGYGSFAVAVKADGTMWAWGDNSQGQLGDNTITTRPAPVQVKGVGGVGTLTGVRSAAVGELSTYAVKTDNTAWGWGANYFGNLGDATTTTRRTPVQVKGLNNVGTLANVNQITTGTYTVAAVMTNNSIASWGDGNNIQLLNGRGGSSPYPVLGTTYAPTQGFVSRGTATGYVIDAGYARKNQWTGMNWTTTSLPSNTNVSLSYRTSNDTVNWTDWSDPFEQDTQGTTNGSATITTPTYSRYIDIKITLESPSYTATPTLDDFSLEYVEDSVAPTNASGLSAKTSPTGSAIQANTWTSDAQPYFSWSSAIDDIGGTGIQGYCLYLGQDADADLTVSKGILGTSPVETFGQCQYMVASTELDTAVHQLSAPLTSSNQPYYFLVKAIDNGGNVTTAAALETHFRFDGTAPSAPTSISAPAQFIATKDITITWPTEGSQGPSDAHSGVAGLQYRIGSSGTWYGDTHSGAQDGSDLLVNDGSYTLDPVIDYPAINEGINILYFRAVDAAGNPSSTYTTAALKLNTSAPTPPLNLQAQPAQNTANAFAFSWDAPQTFEGQVDGLTYCYTVNTLPTPQTCTYTASRSLPIDAYATQPGENKLYVVAKDEAGNINYSTAADVTFTANTPAPGIATNIELGDISSKALQLWKLALSWTAPEDSGAGVNKYQLYRSTDGVVFTQIASVTGTSYVDGSLQQQSYSYKIKACDSANNCGAYSQEVTATPTGRYTSPAELLTSPSVEVSARKATVNWVTDRASSSRVQIGTSPGSYSPSEVAENLQTRDHSIQMVNLEPGTTYYYRAAWTDEDGNTGYSTEQSFTTASAPTIKDVSVVKRTINSATIEFTSKDAVEVSVEFGTNDTNGGKTSVRTSRSESTYRIDLENLSDGTLYYYRLVTKDVDGSTYNSYRTDSFTTPPRPTIENLRFQPVEGEPTSTQLVTWQTNIPTTSLLRYAKIGDSYQDISNSNMLKEHSVIIRDLEDASMYALTVQIRDADGNVAISERQEFRTAFDTRPPKIYEQKVTTSIKGSGSEARGQIIISWKTDEPATSQVSYTSGGTKAGATNTTAADTRLKTDHVVVISNLPVSTIYTIQPISSDISKNAGTGNEQSAIIGRPAESVLTIIFNSLFRIFGI